MTAATERMWSRLSDMSRQRGWSQSAVALADRAQATILLREWASALKLLDDLRTQTEDAVVPLVAAEVAYAAGDYGKARDLARASVDRDPTLMDAWILGFRASVATSDLVGSRKWLDAIEQLFPRHPRTLRARAQLAWEEGEISVFRAAMSELPDEAVFAKAEDADLKRLLRGASVVVGDRRVSVVIGVFVGCGIRSILVGWRDNKSVLPEPTIFTRWRGLNSQAAQSIKIEPIDLRDAASLKGIRVEGLEQDDKQSDKLNCIGMLEMRANFGEMSTTPDDAWGGLMLVDVHRKLVSEPRRLWAHKIRGLPEDDFLDLPRSRGAATGVVTGSDVKRPTIFMSYAREDIAIVEWLDRALREHGFYVWKDDRSLRAGDAWEARIEDAIEQADFVVLCLSPISLMKRGYVQVELRRILNEAERRPIGRAYAIPVRLAEVQLPRILRGIHHVDIFPDRQQAADLVARHIVEHWSKPLDE